MLIKLCVFDLDGTLLDTVETMTECINKALLSESIPPISKNECIELLEESESDMFVEILKSRGVFDLKRLDALFRVFTKTYQSAPVSATLPFPGVRELLGRLSDEGVHVAVYSNRADTLAHTLICSFFPGIAYIQGYREGDKRKPGPEGLWQIASHFDVSREEILYIGDSELDIEMGKRAHIKTLSACWGYRTRTCLTSHGASFPICLPEEVLDFLEQ